MDQSVKVILDRVEICIERGQFNVAQSSLNEASKRAGQNMDDEIAERIEDLQARISEGPKVPVSDEDYLNSEELDEAVYPLKEGIPAGEPPCKKCRGTGRYLAGPRLEMTKQKCVVCKGKGWMDAADKVRDKNYWARREKLDKARKAASGDNLFNN